MTITAEVEGLRNLEFPDGTDPAIIQATVKKQLQLKGESQDANYINNDAGVVGDTRDFKGRGSELIDRIVEPTLALGTGLAASIPAGLAGISQTLNPFAEEGAGERIIAKVQEALTFKPRTESGEKGLEDTLASLKPLADLIDKVRTGEETLEAGYGPFLATINELLPEFLGAMFGVKGVGVKQGLPKAKIGPKISEAEKIIAAGEKQGVSVLTTDVVPPKTIFGKLTQQFAERIPFIGTGGARAKQQTQRINAIESLDQSTPNVEPSDIFASLQSSAKKTKNAAGKRLNQVVDDMGDNGIVPVPNTFARIGLAIQSLGKKGRIPDEVLMKELEELRIVAKDAGNSFESLRDFRTAIRKISEKVDESGRSQLASKDKILMDRIVSGITKDLDNFVLANTGARGLARYKRADAVYRQEALKLTKSRLKTVLDKGEVKPELINNLLFSSSPSEVKLLFQSLDASGRQNARMALLRNALDKSTKKGQISPQLFISELDKQAKNFNVFFRGESRSELQGIKKLFEATERAASSGVVTPTGQALQIPATTAVLGGAMFAEPSALITLLSASTIGGAARIYESSGVRNMMIRLGKAAKGSSLETDLKNSIPLLLDQISEGRK